MSPGSKVISAEVTVDAAVSSMTVCFFSSREAMVFWWFSGAETYFPTTVMDKIATSNNTAAVMHFCLIKFILITFFPSRFLYYFTQISCYYIFQDVIQAIHYTFQDVTSKTAATASLFSHHTSGTVSADPSMSFCPRYSDNGWRSRIRCGRDTHPCRSHPRHRRAWRWWRDE